MMNDLLLQKEIDVYSHRQGEGDKEHTKCAFTFSQHQKP